MLPANRGVLPVEHQVIVVATYALDLVQSGVSMQTHCPMMLLTFA